MTTIVPVSEISGRMAGCPSPFVEAFGEECLALLERLGLGHADSDGVPRVLGLTSCLPAEGVTTVAAELAVAAATHLRLRTALVDCHFGRPGVHRLFGVSLCPGLRDVLEDDAPPADVLRTSGIESLSLVTAGTIQKDKPAAWISPRMARVVEELRGEFDLILFDFPPLNQGGPVHVGTLVDGVLLVVEAERVQWQIAQRATTSFKSAGTNLLGAVLNKRRQHLPAWLSRTWEY